MLTAQTWYDSIIFSIQLMQVSLFRDLDRSNPTGRQTGLRNENFPVNTRQTNREHLIFFQFKERKGIVHSSRSHCATFSLMSVFP